MDCLMALDQMRPPHVSEGGTTDVMVNAGIWWSQFSKSRSLAALTFTMAIRYYPLYLADD